MRTSFSTLFVAALLLAGTASAEAPIRFEASGRDTIGGAQLGWRSVVEETQLDGASIFTTSYLKAGKPDPERPVIFAFNGAPGSSSIWLHLGLLAPDRVDMDDAAAPRTAAPFRMLPNPDSPLDVADIVLIDPPGTGYSRILPEGKPENYLGVAQDARATAQVIRDWLRRNGRTNAPKYLLSESYGTIRAAAVAKMLAGGPTETGAMDGVSLNGVILLGQAMDMARGAEGDDRPTLALLPSLAATACHFRKGPAGCTPEGQADAARAFAADSYLKALYVGAALPAAERDAIAGQLAELTGLPKAEVLAQDLRISAPIFAQKLLAAEGRRIGLYDARFTLPARALGSDPVADDPAMGQYVPAFVAGWQRYSRERLNVAMDRDYVAIAFRDVNGRWDWGRGPGIPPARNYATDLAVAMARNPKLRLLVGTGLYDLVTPVGAAEYTVRHAGIPLEAVRFRTYRSGHMPYLGAAERKALANDIRAFVKESE